MKEWVMENKLNIKEYLDKDEQKDLLRLLTAGWFGRRWKVYPDRTSVV